MTIRATWVFLQRALLTVGVLMLLGLAILPRLGLYRPVTVLSGSMRPTFSPGDMVFLAPEPVSAVRVGQVISYRVPVGIHQVETHRIVKILKGGANPVVQTKGDANNYPDPWTARLEGATAWHEVGVGAEARLCRLNLPLTDGAHCRGPDCASLLAPFGSCRDLGQGCRSLA